MKTRTTKKLLTNTRSLSKKVKLSKEKSIIFNRGSTIAPLKLKRPNKLLPKLTVLNKELQFSNKRFLMPQEPKRSRLAP